MDDPQGFWEEVASHFTWRQKWSHVLKSDFITPDVRWFEGGKFNITENCLDRHIEKTVIHLRFYGKGIIPKHRL